MTTIETFVSVLPVFLGLAVALLALVWVTWLVARWILR